MRKNNVPVYLH